MTFLAFKQIITQAVAYLKSKIVTAYKIRKVSNYYDALIL
jgi:hypothetical protein